MLNTKSFLCLDFGAGTLKAAEFEQTEAGGLILRQFGVKSLGQKGAQEAAREGAIQTGIQELFSERDFAAKSVNVCAPGFHVFSKFVRLPPVDTSKVTQIIQYEAQQNVPFPLEDVVWDYQILGSSHTGELEVLLVALKSDIVEALFRCAESRGLKLNLVDVAPAALCNAFRYNYGELEGCTMLLDIGAKTSNLLFFEEGKFYSRNINIGSNSITQDFANESKMAFADAEQFKIAEGFVSLGGAYEEPENPQQAQISKIARQVMTRLHIQVNQTIQFYRGQQGGSAPQRVFLAGGASIMPYTAQFFAEKLNLSVEYFNPFRNIEIDPNLNLEELASVAHSYGETVGLGLRNPIQCPVELNLMPKTSLKRQQFNQKKPYFIATIFSLVLVIAAVGWLYGKLAQLKAEEISNLEARIQPLASEERQLSGVERQIQQATNEISKVTQLMEQRFVWLDLLTELRTILQEAERKTEQPGIKTGVWVASLEPITPESPEVKTQSRQQQSGGDESGYSQEMMDRYGIASSSYGAGATTAAQPAGPSTNSIDTINLVCQAVNTKKFSPTTNQELIDAVEKGLQQSSMFDSNQTKLVGSLPLIDESVTNFNFRLTLKLQNPIKW